MSEPTATSVLAAELDAMISRAEAACMRYQTLPKAKRRGRLEPLEQALARLVAQRDASLSSGNLEGPSGAAGC